MWWTRAKQFTRFAAPVIASAIPLVPHSLAAQPFYLFKHDLVQVHSMHQGNQDYQYNQIDQCNEDTSATRAWWNSTTRFVFEQAGGHKLWGHRPMMCMPNPQDCISFADQALPPIMEADEGALEHLEHTTRFSYDTAEQFNPHTRFRMNMPNLVFSTRFSSCMQDETPDTEGVAEGEVGGAVGVLNSNSNNTNTNNSNSNSNSK